MTLTILPEERERRHEIRLLFLTATAYVLVADILELVTLSSEPSRLRLLVGAALMLLIAGRYVGWSRLPYESGPGADLPYLAAGAILVSLLALVIEDRVTLYFYMLSFEGCAVFFNRRLAAVWNGMVFALAVAVSLVVLGSLPDGQSIVQDLLVFALNYVATDLLNRQERQRARVEGLLAELDHAYRRLQEFGAQAEALAVAEERNRMAREIHDTLGHTLTALDVQLALLARLPVSAAGERRAAAAQAGKLVKDGLAELRRAVKALRPGALDTFSLPQAVAALIDDARAATGLVIRADVDADIAPPSAVALVLYRTTQEALTNVSRHAQATLVSVTLQRGPDGIQLTVEDNGRAAPAPFGVGLRGLEERAAAHGGTLIAGPAAHGGFRLSLVMPEWR